jgi:hypothetical protein
MPSRPLPSEKYGVGTIAGEHPNTQIKIGEEFAYETYERYLTAIHNSLAPLSRFNMALVEKNFQTYLNVQKFVSRLLILGRDFGIPNHKNLGESVMGRIINWLTSFRLFLDHAETNLKRKYGKDSVQVERFKIQTASAFDDSPGYRFISRFRNYVQHCGSPLSSITIGRTADDGAVSERTVSFRLDSTQLLQDFDWGPVRKDLATIGGPFELEPLAREAMERLRDVDRLLLDVSFEEGARTIADVREALARIPGDEDGVRNLFRFTVGEGTPPPIVTITPQPFPSEDAIEQYEALAAGYVEPSDLRTTPSPPDPFPFDPATVAERFHRDSRAVQAMTLWQSEGGATPEFVQHVNAMIREDGNVDTLLTGFFNMTGVLIHMTAAAAGVDPRGIIGGLLDIYPDPPS